MDGYDLIALIFAREISDPLTSLVKRIDGQLAARAAVRKGRLRHGVFVIFCNEDPEMRKKLEGLAGGEQLKQVVLCTNPPAGPKRYKVAKEADVTVVVYDESESVTANFPLKKGELTEDKARAIVTVVIKALPTK